MRKDGYVVVQPWMVTDYDLNGNKLLIYALIWGFSQDEQSCFYGSVSYIVEYFKLSKRAVLNLLAELEKDGLIRKWTETVNGRPTNRYAALRPAECSPASDGCKKCTGEENAPVQDVHPDGCKKCTSTGAESAPKKEKEKANNNKLPACAGAQVREEPSSLTAAEVFDEFSRGGPAGLYDALMDFDRYRQDLARKDKKKIWNALVAKKTCKSIKRLVDEAGVKDRAGYAIAMLNQSIENGWTGVFAVKDFSDKTPAAVHKAAAAPDKPRKITGDRSLAELLLGGGIRHET